jgi:DNA-directed RNA polymerase specialized sigma24 family protein
LTYPSRVRPYRPIARAARSGDRDARRVLMHHYDPLVRDFLQALAVPSPEAAAEHVWSHFERWPRGRTERDFAVALFRVARETANRIALEAQQQPGRRRPRGGQPASVLEALSSLPIATSEVVALRVVVGFGIKDVVKITGRAEPEVRQLANDALAEVGSLVGLQG